MTEREIFWHNYRTLRPKMRNASPEDWRFMKAVAKVGLIDAILGTIVLGVIEQFKDANFASGGIVESRPFVIGEKR